MLTYRCSVFRLYDKHLIDEIGQMPAVLSRNRFVLTLCNFFKKAAHIFSLEW